MYNRLLPLLGAVLFDLRGRLLQPSQCDIWESMLGVLYTLPTLRQRACVQEVPGHVLLGRQCSVSELQHGPAVRAV